MSIIKIQNLTKKFGAFIAVDSLNITIEQGKIFAFLGSNGAGKTTTIKMMTGALRPTSGSVEIAGFDISKNPVEAKMLMGVIPDRPYLYGKLTGREFLKFSADMYRTPNALAEERITKLLHLYGLNEWQDDLIEGYSHGMKQRLMMCAAQVHDPQILVVDEPMVGLDPRGAKLLKEMFRKRVQEGLTIFMSTHSLTVAEEVADHLAIIDRGKIVADGTLGELRSKSNTQSSTLESVFLDLVGPDGGFMD